MSWQNSLRGNVRFREPLRDHTSFKIGGKAQFFVEPRDASDLQCLLLSIKKKYGRKMPIRIIGAGSNILAGDKALKGVVLHLSSPFFKKISSHGSRLETGGGLMLPAAIRFAGNRGLSGLESLAGIPGTVGGALMMNAGARGKNIGDLVENIRVMDYNGNVKDLDRLVLKFGYRKTNLSGYIILSAILRLRARDKKQISDRIKQNISWRRTIQDLSHPSAGCVFKNPRQNSAGNLIELCGLKGKRIHDACVSAKHANFIVNLGHASSADVLRLMNLVKKEVKGKFRQSLEPEIKIWR